MSESENGKVSVLLESPATEELPASRVFHNNLVVRQAPMVGIYEKKGHFLVHVELPGVSQETLKVYFEDNSLIIKAESNLHKEMKRDQYMMILNECFHGKLYRQITFHSPIKHDSVEASYHLGILTLKVEKDQEQREEKSYLIKVNFS